MAALLIAGVAVGVAGSAAVTPLAAQGEGCDRKAAPALTEDQKGKIKALQTEFEAAHKADLDAVKAARAKAKSEREAGASKDSAKAGMESVRPQMERLQAARQEMQTKVDAILTAEQRATGCYGPMGKGGKKHKKGDR
jgi:chromosome segregation ATPase